MGNTFLFQYVCVTTHSDSLQGLHHDPVDLVKQSAGHLLPPGALQVQTQVTDRPLPTVDMVIVILQRVQMYCTHVEIYTHRNSYIYVGDISACFRPIWCVVYVLSVLKTHTHTHTYPMSLNGHIGQVHKHVVQFTSAGGVLHCAKPAETQFIPGSNTKVQMVKY